MKIEDFVKIMVEKGASDLHLRSGGPAYIRAEDVLAQVPNGTLSAKEVEDVAQGIMSARAKKIFAERQECDFSFQMGQDRFRVNAFRQRGQLCLAVRRISVKIPTMEELHLPAGVLQKICQNPRGLVLVTGTSGSGKSSTLATMVDYINSTRASHIITIEDPIEYVHQDKKSIVTQRELGEDTASYPDALRMVLRQDPDVVLVGEMRDLDTTRAALTAAQTGHLVFSTLHTIDASQTIARIVDLFPPHQQPLVRIQLADTLRAVVSQRLLPGSGGKLVPAMEILVVTPHVRKLIEENKSGEMVQAMQKGGFYGMQTFNQSLARLVKDGLCSEEEVLAVASSPDDLKLALRGIEQEVQR